MATNNSTHYHSLVSFINSNTLSALALASLAPRRPAPQTDGGDLGACWGNGNYDPDQYLLSAPPIPCGENTFSTASGATSVSTCVNCPSSTYSAEGSGTCSPCELHSAVSFVGTSHCVNDQIELFDKIINRNLAGVYAFANKGRSLMESGDKLNLAVGKYQVGEGTNTWTPAATEDNVVSTYQLSGRIECALDTWNDPGPLCVISGEKKRRIFWIQGTDPTGEDAELVFNSIHLFEGKSVDSGGAAIIISSTAAGGKAIVVLELCKISKNEAVGPQGGGGIAIDGMGISNVAFLRLHGTTFTSNTGGNSAADMLVSTTTEVTGEQTSNYGGREMIHSNPSVCFVQSLTIALVGTKARPHKGLLVSSSQKRG